MRIAQWTGLWALLCVCSIVAPGVADADWKIDRAKAVAAKAWDDPCPGRVQVGHGPPQGPGWLAYTLPSQCRIVLSDRGSWPWSQLCPVLVHEYGHLAGYRDPLNPSDPFHSHDPDHVMYAFIRPDPRCDGHGSAYLGTPLPAGARPDPEQRVGRGIARKRTRARRASRRGGAAGRATTRGGRTAAPRVRGQPAGATSPRRWRRPPRGRP